MGYRIDRDALHAFIDREIDLCEQTPIPDDLKSVFDDRMEPISDEEERGIWLAAGLGITVGMAILDEPERFITDAPIVASV